MTTETTGYSDSSYDAGQSKTRMTGRETPATGSLDTGIVGREDMYVHKDKHIGRSEVPSDARGAEFYKDGGMTRGY